MNSPKLSVIVPIYNQESYLMDCVNSILNQSYTNYEILLIDDGSTDYSCQLCDELAGQYQCVKTFHIKNGGVSKARNYGIEKALGDYITFVDSDDELLPNAYSLMIDKIGKEGIDYVFTGIQWIVDGVLTDETTKNIEKVFSKQQMLDYFCRPVYGRSIPSVCLAIFKKSLINHYNIRFRNDIFSREDFLFNTEYVLKITGKSVLITEPTYKYMIRNTNTTSSFYQNYNEIFISGYYATKIIYKMMKDYGMKMSIISEDYLVNFEQVYQYSRHFQQFEMAKRIKDDFFQTMPKSYYHYIKYKRVLLNLIKRIIPQSLYESLKRLITKICH